MMGNLIADIFVTSKPTNERGELTRRSIDSLLQNTDPSQYRLTICADGSIPPLWPAAEHLSQADYLLLSQRNEGLGPTINRAVSHIKSINDWYLDPQAGDASKVAPLIVMCQDDLLYSRNWLPILASRFMAYEDRHSLGFASGVECIEHPIRESIGTGMVLKDWIRAAQVMGRRSYWESLMPIPRFDPETGHVRARPNDGMGSGVDWWIVRNHENSVCRTGRTCLVMPGLVQHMGFSSSTWLKRELPESDSDKEMIRNG